MKTLLNPWFIAGCLIWVTVMITRKTGHPLPMFINGYVDDVFAVPVIANLSLCYMRVFVIGSNYYVLSAWKVVFIVIYLTLVFEVLLPLISKTYTSDWIDAGLYVFGGFFFYFVMNKPLFSRKY
ncbi:MAG TPA: hypothetical protein VG367_02720 [Mucilaginibacter sp.]|jgi:hypothetical protein|nr:hypothetical protein [Mucilaginibacter sp.]